MPLLPEAGETYKRTLGTKDTREAKPVLQLHVVNRKSSS
ncbi:hypothetical protein [Pseudomonas syringae]